MRKILFWLRHILVGDCEQKNITVLKRDEILGEFSGIFPNSKYTLIAQTGPEGWGRQASALRFFGPASAIVYHRQVEEALK